MENDQSDGDPAEENPEDYVGYGSPPRHTRWQPGHCPNPTGRPRKAKGRRAILERIANELCRVKIGATFKTITRLEVVLLAVRNATANGDPQAQKIFDKLMNETTPDEPLIPKAVLIVGEKLSIEEWEVEYGHLGGYRPPPHPKPIQMARVAHLLRGKVSKGSPI